jgi:hypothetical protein
VRSSRPGTVGGATATVSGWASHGSSPSPDPGVYGSANDRRRSFVSVMCPETPREPDEPTERQPAPATVARRQWRRDGVLRPFDSARAEQRRGGLLVSRPGRQPVRALPPASTAGDVDELSRVAQMHDSGALSDAELAAAKTLGCLVTDPSGWATVNVGMGRDQSSSVATGCGGEMAAVGRWADSRAGGPLVGVEMTHVSVSAAVRCARSDEGHSDNRVGPQFDLWAGCRSGWSAWTRMGWCGSGARVLGLWGGRPSLPCSMSCWVRRGRASR